MVAALLAFLFGFLSIHRFYLGFTKSAILQIILNLFLIGYVWVAFDFLRLLFGVGFKKDGRGIPLRLRCRMNRTVAFALLLLPSFAAAEPPSFYADKTKLLVYRDGEGKEHPVKNAADWQRRRAHILAGMQEVMGALPDAKRKVPLDVKVSEEVKTDKYVRRKLTFAVETATACRRTCSFPWNERANCRPSFACTRRNGNSARAWSSASVPRRIGTTPSTWPNAATSPWPRTTSIRANTLSTRTSTVTPAPP